MIGGLFSLLGSGISSFFGFKSKQADVITNAMKVIGDVNSSSQAKDVAAASVIVAESRSESWLTRTWRPLFMVTFMIMLLSYWFGYVPPNLLGPMPPIVAEMFSLIKIGLVGYGGSRGIEKIIGNLKLGSVLQKFIDKKLA